MAWSLVPNPTATRTELPDQLGRVPRDSSMPSMARGIKPPREPLDWKFHDSGSTEGHSPPVDLATPTQVLPTMSAVWPRLLPEERRLRDAVELDRADISFDDVAAGILGRLYDLGPASVSDLTDWFQSPDQWIAFSRLQRCRYVEDLGSQFTLSREGREFVEDLLAEDATA